MILGIDVSEHNGVLDWKAIKDWGISFAILRLGYGKGHLDGRFYENINGALAAGLKVGTYYYSYALTVEEARDEARFTAYVLKDCGITAERLPVGAWFDMEDADGWKERHGMPGNKTITAMCGAYMKEMNREGYLSGIYANYDWLIHRIDRDALSPYTFYWCAQWAPHCDLPGTAIWQYTDRLEVCGRVFDGNLLVSENWGF